MREVRLTGGLRIMHLNVHLLLNLLLVNEPNYLENECGLAGCKYWHCLSIQRGINKVAKS